MAIAPASDSEQGSATSHHTGVGSTAASETTTANNSLVGRLLYFAATHPDHDAITSPARQISYAQLARLLVKQVARLEQLGVASNSVVGIMCAEDIPHLMLCLAASYLGASSCTIPSYEAEETRKLLIDQCGVTHLLDNTTTIALEVDKSGSSPAEALTPADGTACLLFSTSGTTGKPKLVIHHDSDLVAQAHRHISSNRDRFACLASMEHNFAKRHRLYCLAAGATNIFLDAAQESLATQCQTLTVNVLHVSAFQAQELLATPGVDALSNIRLKLGGSHATTALREKLRHQITPTLQAGYGTTETGAIAFTDPDDSQAGESVGQPLPGIEIRTVSPERQTLPAGERGELAIRCEGMFRGYLNNPEQTAARLADNWFYTGDIGYIDQQQRIHLCGRADDMFVFNSMNIYPQDIESQIRQYPGVIDTAVLPKASAVHGSIPIALVVFGKDTKPKLPALKKFLTQQLGLRCPRQFILVDEIPRNASGKIVRQQALGLSARSDEIRQAIIQALDAHPSEFLKPDLIEAFAQGEKDITLRELALDSIARMELLIKLELEYDAVITPQEFARFRSLGNIVARVLALQTQQDEKDTTELEGIRCSELTEEAPYVIRSFQRIFRYCPTVAQLHKALNTLEFRLTPQEIEQLYLWHSKQQLIPPTAAEKFHSALTQWLARIRAMMFSSGKHSPEPFAAKKIAPAITYFTGPGLAKEKTLLICFAVSGGRSLMMPNAVLLQHTDANQYDVLLIAEPFNESYRRGLPFFGGNVIDMVDRLAALDLIRDYHKLRTLGCSAGGYPAVIAGFRLGAELAISIGGRFHSERHPRKILGRLFTTWRGVFRKRCDRILMTYAAGISRDRHYARVIAWLTGGTLLAIEFLDERARHHILQQLAERGELAHYLSQTLFADIGEGLLLSKKSRQRLTLPAKRHPPS